MCIRDSARIMFIGKLCRFKAEEEAKHTSLSAKYLQPLVKGKGAAATPEEDMRRFHYRLLKGQLPPRLHKTAQAYASLTAIHCAAILRP